MREHRATRITIIALGGLWYLAGELVTYHARKLGLTTSRTYLAALMRR